MISAYPLLLYSDSDQWKCRIGHGNGTHFKCDRSHFGSYTSLTPKIIMTNLSSNHSFIKTHCDDAVNEKRICAWAARNHPFSVWGCAAARVINQSEVRATNNLIAARIGKDYGSLDILKASPHLSMFRAHVRGRAAALMQGFLRAT
jgi:hypothetical protein